IAGEALSVDEGPERPPVAAAIATDAATCQANAPDAEELTKRERLHPRRLDVEDSARIVRVEGRVKTRVGADADPARHGDVVAVDVEIEVLVGVQLRALGSERRQAEGSEAVAKLRRVRAPERV